MVMSIHDFLTPLRTSAPLPLCGSKRQPPPPPARSTINVLALCLLAATASLSAAERESDFYAIHDLAAPEGLALEVGGLLDVGDGRLLACTRRGEVWLISGATTDAPTFQLWADGLQEPLGLLARDGWVYCAQRGELTRMKDSDGDDRADVFETVCDDWAISGNYHEYAFGPCLDPQGNLWVTLNKPFGGEPFGSVDWRGWAMRVTPEGEMQPVCAGLRSPCGVATSPDGDVFYTDNQGEWCGASKLSILREGSFHGHPHGIESCKLPQSRVEYPGPIESGKPMPVVAREIESFVLPAVWFPYDKIGRSPSGFVWDESKTRSFGPFAGQVFVGDQYDAAVFRVFLEQVDGTWQGAAFRFRDGFACGITRVAWAEDGSLVVGMTNRGWASKGTAQWGIQRLVYTGGTPFEIHQMHARADGFELTFTRPVDPATAGDPGSYALQSYTYLLHSSYGSPEVDVEEPQITAAEPAADGTSVRLHVTGLREGYVHELTASGLRDTGGEPLLHDTAYYTLQRIPER